MKTSVVVLRCDRFYRRYLVARIADEFDLPGVIRHATPSVMPKFSWSRNGEDLIQATLKAIGRVKQEQRPHYRS